MPTEAPVPANHPLMLAWKEYQGSDDYANTLRWYSKPPQEPEGTLWAAFMAGWLARSDERLVEPVARALERHGNNNRATWDILPDATKDQWRDMARDALKALSV